MGNGHHGEDGGEDTEQPDAYWRRRVITLALGLGLLGILAWGFSGGGGKTSQSSPGTSLQATALGTAIPGLATSAPAAPGSPASPSASGAAPSASGASPSASPSGTAAAGASTRPQPSTNPAAPRSANGGPAGSAGSASTAGHGHCGPGSVVLSLFTDRSSYGPGQLPQFQVYAVSTTAATCSFNPAQLHVQVMASGRVVWDSADCAHVSSRTVELTRGVPAQASVTWDRAITLPGCQVLAASARAGSYTVQARTATVQSPVRIFRISG